jgi:hypothetical protein
MTDIHAILFNMLALYSFVLGVWAAFMAARNASISGNFWGAVGVFAVLALITSVVGAVLALQGATTVDGRIVTYFLYMAFLVVIMPGLFSLLRGRDDRSAAIAFSLLALFNASVAISMMQRGLVTWAFA